MVGQGSGEWGANQKEGKKAQGAHIIDRLLPKGPSCVSYICFHVNTKSKIHPFPVFFLKIQQQTEKNTEFFVNSEGLC